MHRWKTNFFALLNHLWRFSRVVAVGGAAGCLLSLLLLLLPQPTQARQVAATPTVVLDDLPLLRIQLPCAVQTPTLSTFKLTEDGQLRNPTGAPKSQRLLYDRQTLFLFDLTAGSDWLIPSIGDALNRFLKYYADSPFVDARNQFAAFAPGTDGQTLVQISPWTPQPGELIDQVNQFKTIAPAKTALIKLIDEAYNQFATDEQTQRTLIIFSDGLDNPPTQALTETPRAELANQVVIHTIFIPTTRVGNKENLKKIATASKGQPIDQINQTTKVDALLKTLVQPAYLCTITYRTAKAQPTQVIIQEMSGTTVLETTPVTIPSISAGAPVVTLTTATLKEAIVLNSNLAQSLTLPLHWAFPNYLKRRVQSVSYTLFGLNHEAFTPTRILTADTTTQLTIPIHRLAPGNYSLQVEVQDDIGLKGTAVAPFALVLPTPTVMPTPTNTLTPTPQPTPTSTGPQKAEKYVSTFTPYSNLTLLSIALALFLGLCGLTYWLVIVWLRYREEANRLFSSPSSQAPVPALLYRIRSRPGFPLRQVIKLDRDIHLPDDLLVVAKPAKHIKNLEKIRDLINYKVDITKYDSQTFQLYYREKETPITQIKIQSNGEDPKDLERGRIERLEHNDIIQLGSVHYRFLNLVQYNNGANGTNSATPPTASKP